MKEKLLITIIALVLAPIFVFGGFFAAGKIDQWFILPEKKVILNDNKDVQSGTENSNSEAADEIKPVENSQNQVAPVETQADNPNPAAENPDSTTSDKFSFAIVGDTQYANPGDPNSPMSIAIKNISKQNVDAVIAMGDLVGSCDSDCKAKLIQWKNAFGALSNKTYPVMGNHDRTGEKKSEKAWQAAFSLPTNGPAGFSEMTYSLDIQNNHFVFLSSDAPKENEVSNIQRTWLEQDLAKNKKANTFVIFHEPAYPTNNKIGESLDVNTKDRNDLWNIMVRHNVTAVFNGHEHIVSRRKVKGLYQFVYGNTNSFNHDAPKAGNAEYFYIGHSYGIVEVEGKKITVKTYTTAGALLNSFSFSK